MRKELLVQQYEKVICSFHVYIVSKIVAISLLLSFTSMCLLLFVIIPYEYCFFFSGSFSVKGFEACKYCYSSRHCSHTKISHTGIWISGKCHCMFIIVYYVATCIDVILLNVIDLDTVYWGFLPAVCWFWCLILFVCFLRKKTSSNIWMTVAELWAWTMSEWVQTKFMSLFFFSLHVRASLILTR